MRVLSKLAMVLVLVTSTLASAQWTATTGSTGKCIGISMFSDTVGFAVTEPSVIQAAKLMATTDGSTWAAIVSPTFPPNGGKGLKFLTATTGILIRNSSAADAIYKTVDGGLTWTAKPITLKAGSSGTLLLTGLSFANLKDGTVTGALGPGRGFIAVTGDGGETWTEVDPPAVTLNIGRAVMLSPTQIVIAGCKAVASNNLLHIWNSSDRGVTWTLRHQPQLFCGTTIYPFDGAGGSLYFFQGCLGGNCVVKSTDNGDTWTAPGTQNLNGTFWGGMSFSSATHGILVGKTESPQPAGALVFSTSNGGATIRKKKLTGFSSIALKSIPLVFRPKATRSLFTTSERQCGMAMPRPMPVEPRFSRRFSIL